MSDRDIILGLHHEFIAAFNREDLDALTNIIADDHLGMPANRLPIRGVDAARAFWREGLAAAKTRAESIDETIEVSGDIAVDTFRWTMDITPRGSSAPMHDEGKCVWTWRREKGGWKLASAIWNSDLAQGGLWTGAPKSGTGQASAELSRADLATLQELFSVVERHVSARNYAAWASCFAPDAVFMFQHSAEARGRAAIEEWGRNGPKVDRPTFSDIQIHGSGADAAWATSAYQLKLEGVAEPDVGKQLVVFKRQADGNWLARRAACRRICRRRAEELAELKGTR